MDIGCSFVRLKVRGSAKVGRSMAPPVIAPGVARGRLLVGALGERLGWWPSRFTDEAARRSLERLFPRTAQRAALESVAEVARKDHDEKFMLGKDSFHLFRLPSDIEDRVQEWLASPDLELLWPPQDVGELLKLIAELGVEGKPAGSGPLRLGKPSRLRQLVGVREALAVYVQSAAAQARSVPYFSE